MRITIRLEDQLHKEARSFAAQSGRTLTAVIEDALRQSLARMKVKPTHQRVYLPVSGEVGGLQPGVDLNNSAALLDLIEPPEYSCSKLGLP